MNLLVLVLLRAWSFLVRKFRSSMGNDAHYRRGPSELGTWLYLAASLLGTAALGRWMVMQMDPMTAVRKQTAAKAKAVEARLGAPMKGVSQHEMAAVDLVIAPSDLDITLADIGALDDLLDKLLMSLINVTSSGGLLNQPKGILLYGPPGTGKTMMAKAIAKHVNAFFLVLQPSAVQSKYYGETNKAIAGVFKLASRLANHSKDSCCIIFIDEVDALLGKRKDMEHEVSLSMKTEFMSLWDGIETDATSRIVILGATNRPHELDEAVLRRFTLSFEVTLPDTVGREDILMTHLKRHCREHALRDGAVDQELIQNCSISGLEGKRPVQWIAEQTEGYSGADLHELAAEAARHSVQSVTQSLRQQALSGAMLRVRAIHPSEQPALCLSDFEAALKVYQPTQQKAAGFQRNNTSASMASIMPYLAALASNSLSDNHGGDSNSNSHSNGDNIPNGNGVST